MFLKYRLSGIKTAIPEFLSRIRYIRFKVLFYFFIKYNQNKNQDHTFRFIKRPIAVWGADFDQSSKWFFLYSYVIKCQSFQQCLLSGVSRIWLVQRWTLICKTPGYHHLSAESNTVTRDYFKHNPTILLKIYLILFIKSELTIVLKNERKFLIHYFKRNI